MCTLMNSKLYSSTLLFSLQHQTTKKNVRKGWGLQNWPPFHGVDVAYLLRELLYYKGYLGNEYLCHLYENQKRTCLMYA